MGPVCLADDLMPMKPLRIRQPMASLFDKMYLNPSVIGIIIVKYIIMK